MSIPTVPTFLELFNESRGALQSIAHDLRSCGVAPQDVLSELGEVYMTAQRGFDPARGRFAARVLHIVRSNLTPSKKKKKNVELVFQHMLGGAGGEDEIGIDELEGREAEVWERQTAMDPLEILIEREEGLPRSRTHEPPPSMHFKGNGGRVFKLAVSSLLEDEIAAAAGLHIKTVNALVGQLERRIRAGEVGDGQADLFDENAEAEEEVGK